MWQAALFLIEIHGSDVFLILSQKAMYYFHVFVIQRVSGYRRVWFVKKIDPTIIYSSTTLLFVCLGRWQMLLGYTPKVNVLRHLYPWGWDYGLHPLGAHCNVYRAAIGNWFMVAVDCFKDKPKYTNQSFLISV